MWADWLHQLCCLCVPNVLGRGTKSELGTYVTTSSMLSPGSPTLQSRDNVISRPACGQIGYITPAVLGGGQPHKTARMRANRLHDPLLSRGSPPLQSVGQRHKWARMRADWLHHPCCLGGPRHLRAADKIRIAPTCGRIGYITLGVSGVPNAEEQGTKSEVGPHVGTLATSPLLSRGSPMLQSGGQKQRWVHMWAHWLHQPCCLWGPQCFGAGDEIRSGPVCDFIIHAVSGVPNTSKQGTTS